MRRGPAGPHATTSAPYASSGGAVSAAGEALQMLPARVARLRIWTEPTTAAASASAGKCGGRRASAAMSVMTVSAPIDSRPSASVMAGRELGNPLGVDDQDLGRSVPSRRAMIRSVPPASSLRAGALALEDGDGLRQRLGALVAEGLHFVSFT